LRELPCASRRKLWLGSCKVSKPLVEANAFVYHITTLSMMWKSSLIKIREKLPRFSSIITRSFSSKPYVPKDWLEIESTSSRGLDLLHNPIHSKWSAHSIVSMFPQQHHLPALARPSSSLFSLPSPPPGRT
jgi:hypothetical protein